MVRSSVTLLRAANIGLSFGSRTLFGSLTFVIEEGERVGLVGVNGSGKSTLMKVLAGEVTPDSGELQLRRGAAVTYLTQDPKFAPGATIASELTVAHAPLREALATHEALSKQAQEAHGAAQEKILAQLSWVSDRIDRLGGWDTSHEAKKLLDRLGVKEWERAVADLSGGNQKRVAIARTLLARPDLLLLDEPTNHLDADTVDWLEDALDSQPGAILLVTHDRYFLDGLVDRIVELGPEGALTSYPGNYEAYLEQKYVALEQADEAQHKRERWIAQEVAWLRQGVEARRTKSKARIDRARKLLAERGFQRPKVAALQTASAPRLGHTVIEAEDVSKAFGPRPVLRKVSFRLQAGERVGLVGPNGIGKTTFVRTVLGELAPDSGTVTIGKNTKVAYYDQKREGLDLDKTVYDAAWDDDWVTLGDSKIALRDYLDDLLFPVPMQKMKVRALSGGERNRLLLAKLFLQGSNVLVLDEPTNDLDIVTLNVLERLLLGFRGSVLLVTHDRYFLDKVATAILAFEGDGQVVRYEGNYDLYRRLKAQGEAKRGPLASTPLPATGSAPAIAAERSAPKARLSYKEQRELENMEAAIEAAENEKSQLEAELGKSEHASNAAVLAELSAKLQACTSAVEGLYARWQVLEERRKG
jgi:ABC transport system ATP-binding/permease protein